MEEIVIELPVCRVCLESAGQGIEMTDTLTIGAGDNVETRTYFECFTLCTQLEANVDDGLPIHICTSCAMELQVTHDFIFKAKNSYEVLMMSSVGLKPEYVIHDSDSQTNDYCEETIYLPEEENVEEIFESECNDLESIDSKLLVEIKEEHEDDTKEALNLGDIKEQGTEQPDESSENALVDNPLEETSEEVENFENIQILEAEEVKEERVYKCNVCHHQLLSEEGLRDHNDQEHGNMAFRCTWCFNVFNEERSLQNHIKRKHQGEFATCEICSATVRMSFLNTHIRQAHYTAKYLCTACPRTFKTTTGLQIHSETHKENRQRDFECNQCHKKFLTERTHKTHLLTHLHREPYQCYLCEKKFVQKINLRLHMQMHRGETMDCMYCNKKFVRKTDLDVHMRFHTGNFPYECKYCQKRFAIVSHLNYHEKRHQGLTYKCEVCGKEFINMSGLRNHSFQHTSMPFNCPVCEKGFATRFKIKRHLKTVHHVEDSEEIQLFMVEKTNLGEKTVEETTEEVVMEDGE